MNFEYVYEISTEVANLAFANLEQKEKIRDSILALVANSCVAYASNDNFRKEISNYRRYAAKNEFK